MLCITVISSLPAWVGIWAVSSLGLLQSCYKHSRAGVFEDIHVLLSHLGAHSLNVCRPSPWDLLSIFTLVQTLSDERVLCDRYGKCVVGGGRRWDVFPGGGPGKTSWRRDPGGDLARFRRRIRGIDTPVPSCSRGLGESLGVLLFSSVQWGR